MYYYIYIFVSCLQSNVRERGIYEMIILLLLFSCCYKWDETTIYSGSKSVKLTDIRKDKIKKGNIYDMKIIENKDDVYK